ncbi:WD40-repeat-containing domain protein [Mucor mucedo]|uniref:WD40-repeat-containing domain protein n=1 Tax=Mucor mucedo TaxID=29922 RepID=UPI00221E547C|nr:WD40-repeat-containing domain protein [Mucor mucedo]KAI7895686.1 WD40-repeat-containing domain protein [Mucor mucedo]
MEKLQANGPFPTELLVSIFIYTDGPTLSSCSRVCHQWSNVIAQFDHVIWPHACHRDFSRRNIHRFWSLQFPDPNTFSNRRSWQDMYRITRNWYTGHVKGYYPTITNTKQAHRKACAVVGSPQEQGMFTSLTLAHDGRVVRSNPNYHHPTTTHQQQHQHQQQQYQQSLMLQSPFTKERSFLDAAVRADLPGWTEAARAHSIVCHFTHPSSKWLVTGGLNGTVAVWDLTTKSLVRMWHGHRGRVLCISMNDEAVVSGGSDSMIRVWDLDKNTQECHNRPTRRGMIDISLYLSGRSDWYQGVGEIAVNGHIVACAPDASGPILLFSLLTGSLVYELKAPEESPHNEWVTEDITAFTRLCLSPFFLLTKGRVQQSNSASIRLVPATNVVTQRAIKSPGYVTKLSDSKTDGLPTAVAQMTPYQLYQYYQSVNPTVDPVPPTVSACINVWNLQTGKIAYRLVPTLETPSQHYTITDVKISPDSSKVFATIEVRAQKQYDERVYCWDFSHRNNEQDFDLTELDDIDPVLRKTGKSWVCFM